MTDQSLYLLKNTNVTTVCNFVDLKNPVIYTRAK